MQYSFYGGKQGRTYNLVAHYDSIKDMVDCFHGGGSYNDVNYNEYVIIDTIINKHQQSNRENGIIYRRGLNYSQNFNPANVGLTNNTLTSYEYANTTVTLYGKVGIEYDDEHGPDSGETELVSAVINPPKYRHYFYTLRGQGEVDVYFGDLIKNGEFEKDWRNFILNPGGGAEYVGQIVGPQGESPELTMKSWSDFIEDLSDSTKQAKKGKIIATRTPGVRYENDDIIFNDDIQCGYCNIQDAYGNITGAIIAFDFPYTIFNFDAESVSPYGPKIANDESGYEDLTDQQILDLTEDEALKNTYYRSTSNHWYIWDDNRIIPDGDNYVKSPGMIRTEIWEANYDTDTAKFQYNNLVREKSDSVDHPYFKDYKLSIPNGIHGNDINIDSTNNYDIYKTITSYNTSANGVPTREIITSLKVINEISAEIGLETIESGEIESGEVEPKQVSKLIVDYVDNLGEYDSDEIGFPTLTTLNFYGDINDIDEDGHRVITNNRLDKPKYFGYMITSGENSDITTTSLSNEVIDIKVLQNSIYALYSDPGYRQRIPINKRVAFSYPNGTNGWTYTTCDVPNSQNLFYWEQMGTIEGANIYYKNFDSLNDLKNEYPYGFGKTSTGEIIPSEEGMIGHVAVVTEIDSEQNETVTTYFYDYTPIESGSEDQPADRWRVLRSSDLKELNDPLSIVIVSTADSESANPKPSSGNDLLGVNGIWLKLEN